MFLSGKKIMFSVFIQQCFWYIMGMCEKVWNESNEYKVAKSTMFLNINFF
jgi:hypothetical protein